MAPSLVYLPNGQVLTVSPVFGGLFFKVNDLSSATSHFPAGWTIVIHSEDPGDDADGDDNPPRFDDGDDDDDYPDPNAPRRRYIHRFKTPTLQHDHLYISSISNPSSNDFKPASSPTRQIAMMLWATLWWYFHQPPPEPRLTNKYSARTADSGKPRGQWRVNINREGIFKGRVVLPKLERMGLIASEESSVGTTPDERSGEGWLNMFVSRTSFWQLDPRIYLFTLSPMSHSPYANGSPYSSRPGSPGLEGRREQPEQQPSPGLWTPPTPGPFHSGSHLPTYYPPPPPQYIFTNYIRHPVRPKPPRQGETFYTRYIPSVGQYLSFRVASLCPKPLSHRGPTSSISSVASSIRNSGFYQPEPKSPTPTTNSSDVELLYKWMNDPRVDKFWGEAGTKEHLQAFLEAELKSKHSFPVIGCWDGKPFGFFSIYWVKEDNLGKYINGMVSDYDRGFHCLVGEQEFRGPHRVKVWLSALVHYCWLADNRTDTVVMEPRVDNEKLRAYCEDVGFFKEREIAFPHKQANLMKIRRDAWEAPQL